MNSYLLTIAYLGTELAGWQRQAGFDTVQEHLEEALARIVGEPVVVHGAGRTDAGVHALRQCAHIRIARAFEPELLLRAINGNLPETVRVIAVRPVPASFHARFSAVGKRYVYRCLVSRILPVFAKGRCWWIRRPVDLQRVRAAAAAMRGEHDFAALSSHPGYERRFGTVRNVTQLRVVARRHGFDVIAQANGFLYNMVRTIAGTLVDVGHGKFAPADIPEILASGDRRRAGQNAPPEGLYLLRVLYPADSLEPKELS